MVPGPSNPASGIFLESWVSNLEAGLLVSRSASWFLLVVALAGLLLARESRQPDGSLAGVDRAFFDWLSANVKPSRAAPAGVVTLVEIDDAVAEMPGRLPLPPLECAAFFQAVSAYDPEVVAVEPTLDWSEVAPGTERILQEQALTVPRLLLSARLGSDARHAQDAEALPPAVDVTGNAARLPDYPEVVAAPEATLRPLAAAVGADNLPGSEDGAPVRDLPLLLRCRGRVVPTMALQTLTLALRLAPSEVSVVLGSHVQFGDRLRLPVDRAGRALLDASVFGRVNRLALDDLALVVAGQATPEMRTAAEGLRHGTVILGRTDQAARTLRLPDGRAVSPAEVLAWAAASLPRQPPVRRTGGWGQLWVGGAFLALATQARRRDWRAALLLAAAALAAYALIALSLFEAAGLWLPLALPVGLTLVICLLTALLPEPTAEVPKPSGG